MRYATVCSGIEGASVAWSPLGWRPVFFSEINRYCCALLAHHYPRVPNLGDLARYAEWRLDDHGTVDVLAAGTPCQSFSVAGERKGMDDPRGALLFAFFGLASRLRARWLVWENVPGVLSVDRGRAFAAILGALADLGYGFAWRVLDAQYFGLAQRRERLFLVGHLGSPAAARAVLFERASFAGHPAPRREAGQDVAGTLAPGSHCAGFNGADAYRGLLAYGGDTSGARDIATTCLAPPPSGYRQDFDSETFVVAFDCKASGRNGFGEGDLAASMRAMNHDEGRSNGGGSQAVAMGQDVRRLTPVEWERLQGYPDGYTAIPMRRKSGVAADAHRYRALGNAWPVPVVRWIGERIAAVDELTGTFYRYSTDGPLRFSLENRLKIGQISRPLVRNIDAV